MNAPNYGSVELVTVGFTSQTPPSAVIEAVTALAESESVELLDVVIVMRSSDDVVTVVEIDELDDGSPLAALEYGAAGLVAEEDAQVIAEALAPGSSALVLAVEQTWERELLNAVAASDAVVITEQLIPSPVVAEAIEAAHAAESKEN